MTDSARLRPILEGFRDKIVNASNTREAVSTLVTRDDGFQNIVTTSTGQTFIVDEPVHFGGRGEAPDPAEYLLAAIGASLSVTLTAHAALRGIDFDAVSVALSADIDGRAFFLPGCDAAPGVLDVTVHLAVEGSIARELFDDILAEALLAVPVMRTLHTMPRVEVTYMQTS